MSTAEADPQYYKPYLQSVARNFGLNSPFIKLTPQQVINGYQDNFIQDLSEIPVYMGGDQTSFSSYKFLSNTTDSDMAFWTGEGVTSYTRKIGLYNNGVNITYTGKKVESITTTSQDAEYSPWSDTQMIDGTDGIQFPTDLSKDSVVTAFFPNMPRNVQMKYDGAGNGDYNLSGDLSVYNMKIDPDFLANSTANEDNTAYDVDITGTINLSTAKRSYCVAT